MSYDAIIVLGTGISPTGELSDSGRESVRLARDYAERSSVHWLIMSGGLSYKSEVESPISEAQAMKTYAIRLGITPERILTEAESRDTFGNAFFTKTNLLLPLSLYQVVIIAGPNHSRERLMYVFDKVFGQAVSYELVMRPIPLPESEVEREHRSLQDLRELFDTVANGDNAALYRVMRQKHPAYKS